MYDQTLDVLKSSFISSEVFLVDNVSYHIRDLPHLFYLSKSMDDDVNMSTSSEDEIYLPINSNEDPDYLNNYSTYSEADNNDLANDDDDQLDNNNSKQQIHPRK